MALNKDRLHSLIGDINKIDERQSINSTVKNIQKDIFDLFVDAKLSVNDKKSVQTLRAGLEGNISSKKLTKNTTINNLEKQIATLKEIENSMKDINTPPRIPHTTIEQGNTSTAIDQNAIIQDIAKTSLTPALVARVYKMDGDMHRTKLKANNNNNSYLLQHDDKTIGQLSFGANKWSVNLDEKLIKQLGIEHVEIPFVLKKNIPLPSLTRQGKNSTGGSVNIQKTKTWKIYLNKRQYDESIENTNKDTAEKSNNTTNVNAIPDYLQDLITTNKQLTNLLANQKSGSTANHTEHTKNIEYLLSNSQQKSLKKIRKIKKLMQSMKDDIFDTLKDQDTSINEIKKDLEQLKNIENKVDSFHKDIDKKFDNIQDQINNIDQKYADKADELLTQNIQAIEKLLDTKLEKHLEECKELIQKQHSERKKEHDDIIKRIEELEEERKQHKDNDEGNNDNEDNGDKETENNNDDEENKNDGEDNNNETTGSNIQIQAHVMDKESLVKKSIEQDVLAEYQQKYAKRRRPQRLAMHTYARFMQNRYINNRLDDATHNNNAIETDATRQQRVSGSIGNFAYEYGLATDEGKVTRTELTSNSHVNSIATDFIRGNQTYDQTVEQFNDFFRDSNNAEYNTGMTGTDIMEQLTDVRFVMAMSTENLRNGHRNYTKIKENIRDFFQNNPNAKLFGISFDQSKINNNREIDKLCDRVHAYKSKAAIKNLNNITANVKLYKIEKDTVDLTQSALKDSNKTRADTFLGIANGMTFGTAGLALSNPWGRAGVKAALGVAGVSAGLGVLPVVGGVAGFAAIIQGIKTYRDYLTEAQKTHEDAMTMGTQELDGRIRSLDAEIKKHNAMQKMMAIRGFGKHAIRTKQRNILKAVNDKMHRSGAMRPASMLMQQLRSNNKRQQGDAIVHTLARLKVGRELDTNFITGSDRSLTEQERKDLLIQLRDTAISFAQKVNYPHAVPSIQSDPSTWRNFWTQLIAFPGAHIQQPYQRSCQQLRDNFAAMRKDINKGRRNMAFRDAGSNLATSATVIGATAGISAIATGAGRTAGTSGSEFQGPHNEYDLGKYENPAENKAEGWADSINDGDTVKFEGEAAVDAVSASRGSFGDISEEVAKVIDFANVHNFNSTTQDAVKEALTTELAKIETEAIAAGADSGNILLTQQRWVDGIEEILTTLEEAGKTGVTIEDIRFDPSVFEDIDIQESVTPGSGVDMQDVINRSVAFNATIDGVPGVWSRGEPLWVVWPGFSNTYAKPGNRIPSGDSWNNTTNESRVRPWSKEAKRKREYHKERKEHKKLMKKNQEHKEAYERKEQIRKHEEAMERLITKKKQQIEQIKKHQQNIQGEEFTIEELQNKKQKIQKEIKEIQQKIDKNAKDLYNNQQILEKIIKESENNMDD